MESDPAWSACVQFLRNVNNVTGEDEESFSDIKGFLLLGSLLDAHGHARPLPADPLAREIGIWVLGFGLWDLTQ
jgi:hypothetical protein